MSHISSLAHNPWVLLNGDTAPDPHVCACLRVGDVECQPAATVLPMLPLLPQFSIIDAARRSSHGSLVWDPDHRRDGRASPFFSVAPVRLDVKADGECRLSVGTADFVSLVTSPYRWIDRVQIAALAGTDAPERTLQWDLIEIAFRYADGRTETRRSSCLPRVATGAPMRLSAQAQAQAPGGAGAGFARLPQQFAEVSTGSRDVVGVKIRGQVTLRANDAAAAASPLGREDLQGRILVFTDASSGHA